MAHCNLVTLKCLDSFRRVSILRIEKYSFQILCGCRKRLPSNPRELHLFQTTGLEPNCGLSTGGCQLFSGLHFLKKDKKNRMGLGLWA